MKRETKLERCERECERLRLALGAILQVCERSKSVPSEWPEALGEVQAIARFALGEVQVAV